MRVWRTFVVWLVIMAVETVHGVLRTLLLAPVVGDFRARQITVFSGALLILAVAWLFIRWLRVAETRALLAVGAIWLVLTVLFELGLGVLVLGYSWDRMFSDYDLQHGGLLGLGLIILLVSPFIAARLRGIRE